MHERDFKELLEMLHARLRAIQEAIQDSKSAIDNAASSQQQTATDEEGRIIAAIVPPDDEYKRSSKTYKHKSYKAQVILNWISGFAFGAAAIAAGGAIYYACIAQKQLRAMHDANTNAETAMKIDQRAWVTISDIKPEDSNIAVSFGNSGKTPARGFTVRITGEPVPVHEEPKLGNEDIQPGVGLIAPNGAYHVFLNANGSYNAKSQKLAIHGRVDYIDIFNDPHWTNFCYYLSADGNKKGFTPCNIGNETDDKPVN